MRHALDASSEPGEIFKDFAYVPNALISFVISGTLRDGGERKEFRPSGRYHPYG